MKKGKLYVIVAMFLLIAAFGAVSVQAAEEVPSAGTVTEKRGWKNIDGKRYYTDASGQRKTGWFTFKGYKFYLDPKADGAAVTGLKKIGGKYYCFTKNGHMLKNKKCYAAGKKFYTIDSKGVATRLTGAEELAARQLTKLSGKTLRAAFDWAAKLPYQAISTAGKTPEYFASYGFSHGRGDCNVQACVFWCMAKVLGYDAHYVTGTVPQANGKDGKHAWVEIDTKTKMYVFDPNLAGQYASVYGKNTGWKFQYGAKHTYKYQNIKRVN